MTYPVRVVVPTVKSREKFLEELCLPSVRENEVAEVYVVRDETGRLNANDKRNLGASSTSCPYLLFVDDDSILTKNCVRKMVAAIEDNPGASFAYSDFEIQVAKDVPYSGPSGVRRSGRFDTARLRFGNFIHTTSLIRTSKFPRFDPAIRRFQDWDLWLTIVEAGGYGVYVPEVLFCLWQIDAGITETVPYLEARKAILQKHGI